MNDIDIKSKVSICLPVHNASKYLYSTINSILCQTYPFHELIIVDNASSDNSYTIAKQFTDPRIKLYKNEQTIFVADNWNKSIDLAKGDFIALFHSDDIYDPNIIMQSIIKYERYPQIGAVFSGGYIIDDANKICGEMFVDSQLKDTSIIDFNLAFKSYIESGRGSFIAPTAVIPKKIYQEIGLYNGNEFKVGLDYDLYFRILEKHPIAINFKNLIKYRIHKDQGSKLVISKFIYPNSLFKLINKYITSPALTIKIDDKVIKSTKRAEKKDYYLCAMNAIKNNKLEYGRKMLDNASNIMPELLDKAINYSFNKGMNKLTENIIRIKYGT